MADTITENPPAPLMWLIGSTDDCDLVVRQPTVSARHCKLRLTAEGFVVEDCDSKNGTFVNGVKVEGATAVKMSDRVTLGQQTPMPWPKIDFGTGTLTIGRAADNAVVLDYANVSAHHARLVIRGDQLTIEDCGSTNGIFVGDPPRKVDRAEVRLDDNLHLGSLAVPITRLLLGADGRSRLAAANPAPSKVGSPSGGEPTPGKRTFARVALATGTCCLVLALGVVVPVLRSGNSSPASMPRTAATTGVDVSPSGQSFPAEAAASSTPTVGSLAVHESSPIDPADTKDRLSAAYFLVLVGNQATDETYRLGTAWAATPDRLVTTAAIACALENSAFRERFPEAWVLGHGDTSRHPIERVNTHARYRGLREECERQIHEYERAAEAWSNEAKGNARQKELEQSVKAQFDRCATTLQTMVGCDVALLCFAGPVAKAVLPLATGGTPLRPRLRLSGQGLAFDREDPYLDPRQTVQPHAIEGRLRTLPMAGNSDRGHFVLDVDAKHVALNYLGSPLLTEKGEVAAMYSRPTPSDHAAEPPPGGTFDATPWMSIQELISEHEGSK